eukprot:gene16578-7839_t
MAVLTAAVTGESSGKAEMDSFADDGGVTATDPDVAVAADA